MSYLKMLFSEIPDGGVKEKRPGDCPSNHAINTERTYNINTLVEKPHYENHSCQSAEIDEEPKRFFGPAAGEEHHSYGKKHTESNYTEKGIGEAEYFALSRSGNGSTTNERIYVAGQIYIRIFYKFYRIHCQHKRSQKAYDRADYQNIMKRFLDCHEKARKFISRLAAHSGAELRPKGLARHARNKFPSFCFEVHS